MDGGCAEVDRFQAREPLGFGQGREGMEQHDEAARKPHREQQAQPDTKISVERGEKSAPMGHKVCLWWGSLFNGRFEVYCQENFSWYATHFGNTLFQRVADGSA